MQVHTGDIWSETAERHVLIPCNNVICSSGLVMGKGLALQAKLRYPLLPKRASRVIISHTEYASDYLLLLDICIEGNQRIGIIQTKRHWRQPSPLGLVLDSLRRLDSHASLFDDERYDTILLGTGNGGLKRQDVLRLMHELPDNVHVWTPR